MQVSNCARFSLKVPSAERSPPRLGPSSATHCFQREGHCGRARFPAPSVSIVGRKICGHVTHGGSGARVGDRVRRALADRRQPWRCHDCRAVAVAVEHAKAAGTALNVGDLVGSILVPFPTIGLSHTYAESEVDRIALSEGVQIIELRPQNDGPNDEPPSPAAASCSR